MKELMRSIQRYLPMATLIVLTAASAALSQETQPEPTPQAASVTAEIPKPQELLNTSGRVRLSLNGALGFGFEKADVGPNSSGDTVSISGGGGIGGGVGLAFGLSRSLDLDLDLGAQVSGIDPTGDNATGSFGRGYLLATLKYKIPTSDTGQFKFGAGLGAYFGGKLKFDRSDTSLFNKEIDYDPALGFHLTGEFERFIKSNVSINIGTKIYFVEYEAKTYKRGSIDFPVSSLSDELRNLNGSGMDFLFGINLYFD